MIEIDIPYYNERCKKCDIKDLDLLVRIDDERCNHYIHLRCLMKNKRHLQSLYTITNKCDKCYDFLNLLYKVFTNSEGHIFPSSQVSIYRVKYY